VLAVFNLGVVMTLWAIFHIFCWLMSFSAALLLHNCNITLNISTGQLWQVPQNYFEVLEVGEEVKRWKVPVL
jgi:hypothetical protein